MDRPLVIIALLLLGCRPQSTAPCIAAPLELDFGEVQARPGVVHERYVKVTNPSSVDRVITARPLEFPFAAPDAPVFVSARSEALVSVRFVAVDSLLHHEELVLTSDDGSCDFTVPLRALGSGLVRASPESLEFTLGAGEVETKEVLLENTRREPITVQVQWRSNGGSAIPLSTPSDQLTIPAGGSIVVPVTASPREWEPVSAELRFFALGQGPRTRASPVPLAFTSSAPAAIMSGSSCARLKGAARRRR